jgi:hypothetical protein
VFHLGVPPLVLLKDKVFVSNFATQEIAREVVNVHLITVEQKEALAAMLVNPKVVKVANRAKAKVANPARAKERILAKVLGRMLAKVKPVAKAKVQAKVHGQMEENRAKAKAKAVANLQMQVPKPRFADMRCEALASSPLQIVRENILRNVCLSLGVLAKMENIANLFMIKQMILSLALQCPQEKSKPKQKGKRKPTPKPKQKRKQRMQLWRR